MLLLDLLLNGIILIRGHGLLNLNLNVYITRYRHMSQNYDFLSSCMRQNSLEVPQTQTLWQQVLMSVNEKLLTGLKVNPAETYYARWVTC